MDSVKTIALVAHDHCKPALTEWVRDHADTIAPHRLVCTGTTGRVLGEALGGRLEITRLKSGPLGGDQQLGAMIAEGRVDILVFFWDPMRPQPHDVDVKALLRIAVLSNIPVACNRATADFLASSPLITEAYEPAAADHRRYVDRDLA